MKMTDFWDLTPCVLTDVSDDLTASITRAVKADEGDSKLI
jgi:hypothetical protein